MLLKTSTPKGNSSVRVVGMERVGHRIPSNPACRQRLVLQVSVFVVALCGIVYELIIAAVSSYLLGNSVFRRLVTHRWPTAVLAEPVGQ